MPAVCISNPLVTAIRHNLDAARQFISSSHNLNTSLGGNVFHILHMHIEFEESDNYSSIMQDYMKNKYIILSLPIHEKTENDSSILKNAEPVREPRLPKPVTTLYPESKVNLGWNDKHTPVGVGMYNIGNTCYLNSTLQALFHIPALANWLLSDDHHNSRCDLIKDGTSDCIICAVAKTLKHCLKANDAIKPYYIYDKLKLISKTMVPGRQEDAHEFLRCLLEGMEKSYLSRFKATKLDCYSKETTPINQIFGGYIRTEVQCCECQHISTTFQHFQDLLLDIRKAETLDEALAGYFSQEQLDNNDYMCKACERRVPALKQFILEKAPKVLCIQLKRFNMLGGKISRHITFDQIVDMSPYIRQKSDDRVNKVLYRLISIVTHMGSSVNCGHYTTVAQVPSGKFYSFDDSLVRQIDLNSILCTNAYIMLFEMESSLLSTQVRDKQHTSLKSSILMSKAIVSFSYSDKFSSKVPNKKYHFNSVPVERENDLSLSQLQRSSKSFYSSKINNVAIYEEHNRDKVTENDNKSIHYSKTSSEEIKNLKFKNRPETLSYIQRRLPWSSGNMTVKRWDHYKARDQHKVDKHRRRNCKRFYNDNTDEQSCGRIKQTKLYSNVNKHCLSNYNCFQDFQSAFQYKHNFGYQTSTRYRRDFHQQLNIKKIYAYQNRYEKSKHDTWKEKK